MQPIQTGILSYGMSGRIFHAPFIETHKGFNFYAVTERSKKSVSKKYPNVKSFNSVEELLNDSVVELVIVNTPNNTHYELAKKALLAGKHVLVEKPFASSSAEARELFGLSRKMNRSIMAYHNRRWDSDFQSVKEVLNSGKLGQLIEVHFRFDRYRLELSPKSFKETLVPATGISYDLGPHLLDQVISLFGKPLKAFKTTGIYRPDSQVDDYLFLHLLYPDQLNVYVTATLLCAGPLPAFVLHGSKGSYKKNRTDVQEIQLDKEMLPTDERYGIEPDGSEGKLTIMDNSGTKNLEYLIASRGNYNALFDAVYNQIRHNETYPVKEDEIIWQMEILESAAV